MTMETVLVPESVRERLDELWGPPSLFRDCSWRAEASLYLTEQDSSPPEPTHQTQGCSSTSCSGLIIPSHIKLPR